MSKIRVSSSNASFVLRFPSSIMKTSPYFKLLSNSYDCFELVVLNFEEILHVETFQHHNNQYKTFIKIFDK